ncbi:MAG: type III-A CRISPR-associated RAMP protein Csm5 [Chloroflexota bacterium]|nr:type III-A CRISPR-associated RAMP protein Csm5 [Chloroflexota bacterium]MBI5702581.1 type III-A CRISPR-associated RAMP protein Csm5 [Chloroflexota bacterium]
MPDYKTYRLKITVLTPLHIGNGREMLRDYDFAERHGEIWRFDENALLETQNIDDPKVVEQLAPKPADLVTDDREYRDGSPLFRYHIPGKAISTDGRVREFIKDVYDRPYLPGSSLKGALRTAIGWWEWEQKGLQPELDKVSIPPRHQGEKHKFDRKKAANRYEQDIFFPSAPSGKGPNYDLMRALHVSDSQPVEPRKMQIVNVVVYRNWSVERADKISSIETLPAGLALDGITFKIDTRLFGVGEQAAQWQKLNFGAPKRLMEWVKICQRYARQRIETEIEYYTRQAKNSSKISNALNLYRRWQSLQVAENDPAFLLQLGWGTGWDGKTFDSRLREDDYFMLEIIKGFNLGTHHSRDYQNGDEFPMSRRLPQKGTDAPLGYPLGWVLVNVAEGDADFVETDWQKRVLETAIKTETPAPAPKPAPKPQPKPLIATFTDVPNIGDRFKGEVFNQEGRALDLFIPGLDDTIAYAHISPENNDTSKRYKEGDIVVCEVIGKNQVGKVWKVECRRIS